MVPIMEFAEKKISTKKWQLNKIGDFKHVSVEIGYKKGEGFYGKEFESCDRG